MVLYSLGAFGHFCVRLELVAWVRAGFVTRFSWELRSPFSNVHNSTTAPSRYFAVGENTAWGELGDYHTWWGNLSSQGANYARVWIGGISQMVLQTYAAGV
jgi:hypothetical protein